MPPVPQRMREPSGEVPGVAVIMHQLSSSGSSEILIDSIRVYPDRIYLRIGLKFRDPESWRAAGIDPDVLMAPETFNATLRYQDGETVSAYTYNSDTSKESSVKSTGSRDSSRMLVQISSQGAGLEWYVDYLILPLPTKGVAFSTGFPRIGLDRGEWLLSGSTIEECLEIRSRYARARKAAERDGYTIKTNLNRMADIVAHLAYLGARVDFGNAKLGWEPAVQVPLAKGGVLSIYEILPGDAINVTINGGDADSYLLEVSEGPGMQIIALSNSVTTAARVLTAGLH